jgi:hypothetical protein
LQQALGQSQHVELRALTKEISDASGVQA